MDVLLFDRTTRPLTLTPAGRLYLDFCKDVVRRRQEFDAALDQMKGEVEGTVRVASIYSVGLSEMTRLEGDFANRFPGAKLEVDYLRPEKVYEAVLADHADLGLASYPEQSKDIRVIPWRQERMVVAVAPTHTLAPATSIEVKQLRGHHFIGFDEDLPISREVSRYLRDAGVDVATVMHFDNIQMIKEAVAIGSGISILPDRILRPDVEQGRLKIIPLEPELFRPLGIVHLRKKKFNRAAQSFLQLLAEPEAVG